MVRPLDTLVADMPILVGGDRVVTVSRDLAERFRAGDKLLVVQTTGDLLHLPAEEHKRATEAVGAAYAAFHRMSVVSEFSIDYFFRAFALHLENDSVWSGICRANTDDVRNATLRGRSTTRLVVTDKMRAEMIAALHAWREMPPVRGRVVETVTHEGWSVEQVVAPLGVIGFVFEGRPNVFSDATGVLRSGNTVVFRIGSDALGTARAIMDLALRPALAEAGLPEGAVVLLESATHASAWSLFSDPRLSLAVARGSGRAVAQLGQIARQTGIPVSLHGTGGGWLVAGEDADESKFSSAVYHSLDRKVCNTLNVCCVPRSLVARLIPRFLEAITKAGAARGQGVKLHVVQGDEVFVPKEWFTTTVPVKRATGVREEPRAEILPLSALSREWEWEETPEVSLKVVANLEEAAHLFNTLSPRFVASLVSESPEEHRWFYETMEAPFIGNGFTRWVDGQFAMRRPELGLSNWEGGRLFARSGFLSGDGVFTIRTRAVQRDWNVRR